MYISELEAAALRGRLSGVAQCYHLATDDYHRSVAEREALRVINNTFQSFGEPLPLMKLLTFLIDGYVPEVE